eukprot:362934-Rhodomonas_salina.1
MGNVGTVWGMYMGDCVASTTPSHSPAWGIWGMRGMWGCGECEGLSRGDGDCGGHRGNGAVG